MTPKSSDPSVLHERKEERLMLMLLFPAVAVIVLLLVVPLLWLAWQSVWQNGRLTLVNYSHFLTDPAYWMTFLTTFRIAFTVTIVTLLLAYPVAYAAASLPERW